MTSDPALSGGGDPQTVATVATVVGDRKGEQSGRFRRRLPVAGIMCAAFIVSAAAPGRRSVTGGMLAYPVGFGTRSVDVRIDPWVAVTDATVAPLLTPSQRPVHRLRRIIVDYDADGVPDIAWMVCNSTQMGVLVRLGVSGRTVLAYRADGRWGDQQLYRTGRRAIEIEFPESTSILLSSESGRPMVYYRPDGD